MGNKKILIQTVIIVVAFSAAGFILYRGGLFGDTNKSAVTNQTLAGSPTGKTTAISTQNTNEILPYGPSLGFDKVIDPHRFQYDLIKYPQLNDQEVGIPENSIITPLVTK